MMPPEKILQMQYILAQIRKGFHFSHRECLLVNQGIGCLGWVWGANDFHGWEYGWGEHIALTSSGKQTNISWEPLFLYLNRCCWTCNEDNNEQSKEGKKKLRGITTMTVVSKAYYASNCELVFILGLINLVKVRHECQVKDWCNHKHKYKILAKDTGRARPKFDKDEVAQQANVTSIGTKSFGRMHFVCDAGMFGRDWYSWLRLRHRSPQSPLQWSRWCL